MEVQHVEVKRKGTLTKESLDGDVRDANSWVVGAYMLYGTMPLVAIA